MKERLLKLLGMWRDPKALDYELDKKRDEFRRELERLELLATEVKLQGRNWDAGDSKSKRDSMGNSWDDRRPTA